MTTAISVALVTRNRPDSLERTLKSLRLQEEQPFEVVVSDDSDEDFAPKCREIAEQFDCRYATGPKKGLYANRNFSASLCKGTHVRTMDDDHEFPSGHWKAVREHVEEDPQAVWIIGEYLKWSDVKAAPHPFPGELHPRGYSVRPKAATGCHSISDGASIYPKTILLEVGPMIDAFKFGAAYLEYGSRIKRLGFCIRHLSETFVIHHGIEIGRSFERDVQSEASEICAMRLHSSTYFPTFFNIVLTYAELTRRMLAGPRSFWNAYSLASGVVREQKIWFFGKTSG